ncbi:MAG: helix-turn-helix transcriptional regulator [Acidimicrobiales bacterium]
MSENRVGADAEPGANPDDRFGEYLRGQRKLANLTLRQLADMAGVSNPYLSQIERGIHVPSVRVIKSIANALDVQAEVLLTHAAGIDADDDDDSSAPDTEAVIRADPRLTSQQKQALLQVYRGFIGAE